MKESKTLLLDYFSLVGGYTLALTLASIFTLVPLAVAEPNEIAFAWRSCLSRKH